MKLHKSIIAGLLVFAGTMSFTACDDYDYDSQMARTDITKFSVVSPGGNTYSSSIDGDKITLKINPFADITKELSAAIPKFYLPMGATCTPSPSDPQDFSKEVKYTVTSGDGKNQQVYTVTWGPSDPLPVGEGYSFSRLLAEKLYNDLGYPGAPLMGENGDIPNGDILLFPAFCGDRIVGFSRVYAWGNTNGRHIPANPDLAFKVWDVNTLEEVNEKLNLGSLKPNQIVNITNDWVGHLVAATGGMNGAQGDIYYWTSLSDAPHHVGTLASPVYTHSGHEVDASMFIQVAGDITGDAVITYMPEKTTEGEHKVVTVRGGALGSTSTIKTGYPSNDRMWFQMISMFGTDETAPFLIGETEGSGNGSVKAYYCTSPGVTTSIMPAHLNGKPFSDGVIWWSGTGNVSSRGGSRRPFVMAMMVNGKPYSLVLTGYAWSNRSQMMSNDFLTYIGDALSYDFRSLEMTKTGAAGLDAQLSYGGAGCWYWDAENNEGRVAIWYGREGLATFMMSSYE